MGKVESIDIRQKNKEAAWASWLIIGSFSCPHYLTKNARGLTLDSLESMESLFL
jgi:hypothetical protein